MEKYIDDKGKKILLDTSNKAFQKLPEKLRRFVKRDVLSLIGGYKFVIFGVQDCRCCDPPQKTIWGNFEEAPPGARPLTKCEELKTLHVYKDHHQFWCDN